MTEVSKVLNHDLYPDLTRGGGLAPALRQVLDQLSCDLDVDQMSEPQMLVYAIVRKDSRSSQVMVAAHHRSFSVDFWNLRVQYGRGWIPDLVEVGRAICAFNLEKAPIQAMTSRFGWFEATRCYQRCRTSDMELAWPLRQTGRKRHFHSRPDGRKTQHEGYSDRRAE